MNDELDKAAVAGIRRERDEIAEGFQVDANGIIRTPGKFEGEGIWVPYFWNCYLDGGADEDDGDGETLTFKLTQEEREAFPELKGRRTLRLRESGDGFVYEVRSRRS